MMSAPLPVASDSDTARSVSELRLATPKSFATGVAQWSNCPISSTVSGRMPSRSVARPRVVPLAD